MIVEAITHIMTPAPKWVKKLGFVVEAIAIEERHKRCKSNWLSHLTKSKKTILEAAKKLPKGSNILVIGAGGLHDMPYRSLAVRGIKMSLLDIVFLKTTRKKVKNLAGISLIEHDITNYAKTFYNWLSNIAQPLPTPPSPAHINEITPAKPDLIISLNILSQLPIQFAEKVRQNAPKVDFSQNEKLLIENHINWLKSQHCPSVVIADIERVTIMENQEEHKDPLPHLDTLGEPFKTWHWDIAPIGEAHKTQALKHKVGAWVLNG